MKNPVHKILITIGSFMGLTLILFGLLYRFNAPHDGFCTTPDPPFLCGKVSPVSTENARFGRAIYNANCAACHKLYQDAIGPALTETDSTTLWRWLRLSDTTINTLKIKDLSIDYHRNTYATTLDSLELAGLYEYLQISY